MRDTFHSFAECPAFYLRHVLARNHHNVKAAALELGVRVAVLEKRLDVFGIRYNTRLTLNLRAS